MKSIKSSNKKLTRGDKISDMYKLTKNEYKHLLDNAGTATKGIEDIINEEGIVYAVAHTDINENSYEVMFHARKS